MNRRVRRIPLRRLRLACLALLVAMEGVACGGGSQAPTGPPDIDPTVASLEIVVVSPSLLIHETALLSVKARNADGAEVPTPSQLQWTSSDEAIARVEASGSESGVVTALRRGTVTIHVRGGGIDAAMLLSVKARVAIRWANSPLPVYVAIAETLQLAARFVDVNGARIDERTSGRPSVTWASGNPGVASVSSTGLVVGLRTGLAAITATSSDGVGTMDVTVTDLIAGLPATVRFAHAAPGRGPLTFVPSQGAPVTLAFGESVEVPIVSGTFSFHVDGLGPEGLNQSWTIRGGDHVALYGTEYGTAALWIEEASVPSDSGLVRFVNGAGPPNWALTLFLGAPGVEVAESRLINCYYDPLTSTEYVRVPAGEFDVMGGGKNLFFNPSGVENARLRATATSGRAVTYVLTGDSPQTARLLAFPDF